MVSKKRKRIIQHDGKSYFWFVWTDKMNNRRIHIISEDKKENLEYPLFDSEVPVTPAYIKHLLDDYKGI